MRGSSPRMTSHCYWAEGGARPHPFCFCCIESVKVLHKALAAEMAAETDLVRGLGAEGAGRAA